MNEHDSKDACFKMGVAAVNDPCDFFTVRKQRTPNKLRFLITMTGAFSDLRLPSPNTFSVRLLIATNCLTVWSKILFDKIIVTHLLQLMEPKDSLSYSQQTETEHDFFNQLNPETYFGHLSFKFISNLRLNLPNDHLFRSPHP